MMIGTKPSRFRRRPFAALLLGGVLSVSPVALTLPPGEPLPHLTPSQAEAKLFEPETFTLENGMQVVVIPNHRVPAVTHMVWYRVGAADEPMGQSGLTHFLEHLMFKGTPAYGPGEFSEIVARNGGRQNAFTSWDYTAYYQTIAKDRLELVMGLEADRMVNLTLTEEVLAPERDVVLEERRSRVDNDPASRLAEMLRAAQYMNHPYRIPIIGWEHEVRGLDTKKVTDYYKRYYAPNNAILVVAGDITAEELRPLAEKTYGALEPADTPPRDWPSEPTQHAPRQVELVSPQVGQPSWRRSYLAPSYTAGETRHAYALEVLANILGGGGSSRLYKSLVVEQGIASSAGCYYNAGDRGPSEFVFYLSPRPGAIKGEDGTDTSPRQELAVLEKALEAEISRVLAEGVTPDEVARAKKRLQAEVVYARDGLATGARVLGRALASGQTVEEVEAWPDRIGAVTVEQVKEAAAWVLRENRSVTGLLLPKPTS